MLNNSRHVKFQMGDMDWNHKILKEVVGLWLAGTVQEDLIENKSVRELLTFDLEKQREWERLFRREEERMVNKWQG